MTRCKLVDLCVRTTKAGQAGAGANDTIARDLAIIGIELMPDDPSTVDRKDLRRRIAKRYQEEHKTGFFFTMIVLPIMVSLISHWLVQWFTSHPGQLAGMKSGDLPGCGSACRMAGKPTCTSTEKGKNSTSLTSLQDTLPKGG